ncbi:MAG TPA: ACT domain-containing protein, partial [Dehalococcoidia bacterium]|nr:ACT domain-containing protein [Dehalococcoidia bacterium]
DRPGLLRDVSSLIAEGGVNITDVDVTRDDGGISSLLVAVEVTSTAQLATLIAKLQSLWSVINVVRKGEAIVR